MLRYALRFLTPVSLFLVAPAAHAAPSGAVVPYAESTRCGILSVFMGILEKADGAEALRLREAKSLTWFALGDDDHSLDEAAKKAAYARVEREEGEAVVALPREGTVRADHLMTRLSDCDALRNGHVRQYKDMARLLALASPDVFAGDAAMGRQGKTPPPLPQKDLSFADGWSFKSRHNNCTAARDLGKGVTLTLAFTNFSDGNIRLDGKALPAIRDEESDGEDNMRHKKGATYRAGVDGDYIPMLDAGVTYDKFRGSGIFVDGAIAGPFDFGVSEEGETIYRFAALQEPVWPILKAGTAMQIKILGKEQYRLSLTALAPMMAEMQDCIDQYPNG